VNPEEKIETQTPTVESGVTKNGGTLKIKVIEARLTHDTETFG